MVPLAIVTVITVMVTIKIWPLVNIFILLMKIQSLRFMVQPGSSAKSVSDRLQASLGYITSPTLTMNPFLIIPKQILLSANLMTQPLSKVTLLHIQILPKIEKGKIK